MPLQIHIVPCPTIQLQLVKEIISTKDKNLGEYEIDVDKQIDLQGFAVLESVKL